MHSSKGFSHSAYRPDIDGLRAVAVLAVVIFHVFPQYFGGGFIGVDVFFVISGYLISSIILADLEREKFSILGFYQRRIRRILPALLAILICCLVAGWFLLLADEYAQLGKHVSGGAAFLSNILLWRETGYFDISAEKKPLLHLWSLGIEEQFYIVWPLLLIVSWRRNMNMAVVFLLLGGLSFAANIALAKHHPTADFYSPVTRFWELAVGGMLAYSRATQTRWADRFSGIRDALGFGICVDAGVVANTLSVAGFALLTAGLLLVRGENTFPGWWALLPVVGALLIIAAGADAILNRRLLSNRLMVGIGLISYPLYIWHWPILAFFRLTVSDHFAIWVGAAMIAASLLLAWLTCRYIEAPLRFSPNKQMPALLLAALVSVFTLGALIKQADGVETRTLALIKRQPPVVGGLAEFMQADTEHPCHNVDRFSQGYRVNCLAEYNPDANFHVVLWGDSHARAWAPVLKKIAAHDGMHLTVVGHYGCPPLTGVRRSDGGDSASQCDTVEAMGKILADIERRKPNVVLLAGRWSLYVHGLIKDGVAQAETHFLTIDQSGAADAATSLAALASQLPETVRELQQSGIKVVIIKQPPVLKSNITDYRKEVAVTYAEHVRDTRDLDSIFAKLSGVTFLDAARLLCRDTCLTEFDGAPLYIDDNHLSRIGAYYFEEDVRDVLALPGSRQPVNAANLALRSNATL